MGLNIGAFANGHDACSWQGRTRHYCLCVGASGCFLYIARRVAMMRLLYYALILLFKGVILDIPMIVKKRPQVGQPHLQPLLIIQNGRQGQCKIIRYGACIVATILYRIA